MIVLELRGLGDDVEYREEDLEKLFGAIRSYLAEMVPDHGDIIEIVVKHID